MPWDVYNFFSDHLLLFHSITLLGNVNDFGSKHCASELSANHNILQVSNISNIEKTDSDDMRRGLALPEIYPPCALNLSSVKPTFAFFSICIFVQIVDVCDERRQACQTAGEDRV